MNILLQEPPFITDIIPSDEDVNQDEDEQQASVKAPCVPVETAVEAVVDSEQAAPRQHQPDDIGQLDQHRGHYESAEDDQETQVVAAVATNNEQLDDVTSESQPALGSDYSKLQFELERQLKRQREELEQRYVQHQLYLEKHIAQLQQQLLSQQPQYSSAEQRRQAYQQHQRKEQVQVMSDEERGDEHEVEIYIDESASNKDQWSVECYHHLTPTYQHQHTQSPDCAVVTDNDFVLDASRNFQLIDEGSLLNRHFTMVSDQQYVSVASVPESTSSGMLNRDKVSELTTCAVGSVSRTETVDSTASGGSMNFHPVLFTCCSTLSRDSHCFLFIKK